MNASHLKEAFINKRVLYESQAYFSACAFPLLLTDVVRIAITYHYSGDRGMWPLLLLFMVSVSFLYSGLAYLLAHLTRHYKVVNSD
jgi:hypothetical protein